MKAQLESGKRVRYNGTICDVGRVNADGTFSLRPVIGNWLKTGVTIDQIEIPDADGKFAPLVVQAETPAAVQEAPTPPQTDPAMNVPRKPRATPRANVDAAAREGNNGGLPVPPDVAKELIEAARTGTVIPLDMQVIIPPSPPDLAQALQDGYSVADVRGEGSEIAITVLPPEPASDKPFDYKALSRADFVAITMAEKEIKRDMESVATAIVRIGENLADVQQRLANYQGGSFVRWIKSSFQMSKTTAYRYIGVYNTFGNKPPMDTLDFTAKALYMLSDDAVPEAVVDEAIMRAVMGEKVTPTVVTEIVKAAQEAGIITPVLPQMEGHTDRPVDANGVYIQANSGGSASGTTTPPARGGTSTSTATTTPAKPRSKPGVPPVQPERDETWVEHQFLKFIGLIRREKLSDMAGARVDLLMRLWGQTNPDGDKREGESE